MSRPRLQVAAHLNRVEILQMYETCLDRRVKTYWLAIYLLTQDDPVLSVEQVAERVKLSKDWIRKLVHRYNRLGALGLTNTFRQTRKQKLITHETS